MTQFSTTALRSEFEPRIEHGLNTDKDKKKESNSMLLIRVSSVFHPWLSSLLSRWLASSPTGLSMAAPSAGPEVVLQQLRPQCRAVARRHDLSGQYTGEDLRVAVVADAGSNAAHVKDLGCAL